MLLSTKNITSVKSRIYGIESREKFHLKYYRCQRADLFHCRSNYITRYFYFSMHQGIKAFRHTKLTKGGGFFFEKFTTFSEEIGEKKRIARSNISGQITVANNASRRKVLSHCSYWPVACFRVCLRCIQLHDDSMTNSLCSYETDENKGIATIDVSSRWFSESKAGFSEFSSLTRRCWFRIILTAISFNDIARKVYFMIKKNYLIKNNLKLTRT